MVLVPRKHEATVISSYGLSGILGGLSYPVLDAATPANWVLLVSAGVTLLAGVVLAAFFPRRETIVAGTALQVLGAIFGTIGGYLLHGRADVALRLAMELHAIIVIGGFLYGLPLFALNVGASLLVSRWRRVFEPRPGHCAVCDYDLTGLTVPRCPECGTPFDVPREPDGATAPPPTGGDE